MKIKYLYKVTHITTGKSWEIIAGSCDEAKNHIYRTFTFTKLEELNAEALTTQEGHGITLLKALPNGSYFWRISPKTNQTQTVPYVKGGYDRSYNGYDCYKFYDACHSTSFSGEMKVTPDVTF